MRSLTGSTTPNHRFENVDALRGIAALLVVWFHAVNAFVAMPGIADRGTVWFDLAELFSVGRIGVVAFFAISGYVIVPTVNGDRREATIEFTIKRFFRLYPAFWMAVVAASLVRGWQIGQAPTSVSFFANLTMLPLEFGLPPAMGHF